MATTTPLQGPPPSRPESRPESRPDSIEGPDTVPERSPRTDRARESEPARKAPVRARLRRWGLRALQATAGVIVALTITECAFHRRDHGAFPHLNVYIADPKLGVRLRPGATERVSFDGNPVTDVRINADGYRGAELPETSDDEILVVGDSQVFGLGVEEGETFSARLHERTGRTVINAGVPTYGPPEYAAVIEEQLAKRRAHTVIYVVNFANDLFEANRPNVERHAVWDGWAVRKETAPDHVVEFPGRQLLFRESHAFYALRAYWHRDDAPLDDRGFSSEGSFRDLIAAQTGSPPAGSAASEHRWASDMKQAIDEEVATQQYLEELVAKSYPDLMAGALGAEYQKSRGNPADILVTERHTSESESGRPYEYTVKSLVAGAAVREKIEALVRKRAEKERQKESGKAILASFDQRQALEKRVAELRSESLDFVRASSPLAPAIAHAKAICDAHGARLVVVALPIDVQVSSAEFAKYGVAPIDLSATHLLLDDVVATSESLGISALDATPALLATEPGAFLYGDIHMTPKGHRALADALATTLAEPPPSVLTLTLPAGRSRVPIAAEWATATPIRTKTTPPGCSASRLREWLRLTCVASAPSAAPSAVALVSGGHGETMVLHARDVTTVVAPVLAGDRLIVDVGWAGHGHRWTVRWKAGDAAPTTSFGKRKAIADEARSDDDAADALCRCNATLSSSAPNSTCAALVAAPDADCARSYGNDCEKLLACSEGDPSRAPRCLEGWLHAGASQHCYRKCGADAPCAVGACKSWQGLSVCM